MTSGCIYLYRFTGTLLAILMLDTDKGISTMKFAFLTFAALLGAIAPAGATTITTLFNTGVDSKGIALGDNKMDSHWSLGIEMPTYAGAVNGSFPIGPWVSNTLTARWVSPAINAGSYDFDHAKDGIYTYTETFSLAGYRASTAKFSGQFASDNTVDSITLNGTTLAAKNISIKMI